MLYPHASARYDGCFNKALFSLVFGLSFSCLSLNKLNFSFHFCVFNLNALTVMEYFSKKTSFNWKKENQIRNQQRKNDR